MGFSFAKKTAAGRTDADISYCAGKFNFIVVYCIYAVIKLLGKSRIIVFGYQRAEKIINNFVDKHKNLSYAFIAEFVVKHKSRNQRAYAGYQNDQYKIPKHLPRGGVMGKEQQKRALQNYYYQHKIEQYAYDYAGHHAYPKRHIALAKQVRPKRKTAYAHRGNQIVNRGGNESYAYRRAEVDFFPKEF